MATKDFEVKQLLRAYRKGVISDELFAQQMAELGTSGNGDSMPNVFAHRGNGGKVSSHMLGKTGQSESMVFSLPAHFNADRENSHRGDQTVIAKPSPPPVLEPSRQPAERDERRTKAEAHPQQAGQQQWAD